jgi:hypothetical protein
MNKHDHPRCHGKRLAGRSADRPTKRRLIRDADHLRGVKAARTRSINRTMVAVSAVLAQCEASDANGGFFRLEAERRIRAILEDVL